MKHLIIWGSTGDFYRVANAKNTDEEISRYFVIDGANAIEIMLHDKEDLDNHVTKGFIEKNFSYCSMHAPVHAYKDDIWSHKILKVIEHICSLLPIRNIVVHPDTVIDRDVFKQYGHLPFSIENMDEEKSCCQWVEDIRKILDDNPRLWFTLDLQHAFVNDPSMQLAKDFHRELGERIVQYHLSWSHPAYRHYALFKTRQMQIIKAIENKDIPIIVESTFDEKMELKEEIEYIKDLFVI